MYLGVRGGVLMRWSRLYIFDNSLFHQYGERARCLKLPWLGCKKQERNTAIITFQFIGICIVFFLFWQGLWINHHWKHRWRRTVWITFDTRNGQKRFEINWFKVIRYLWSFKIFLKDCWKAIFPRLFDIVTFFNNTHVRWKRWTRAYCPVALRTSPSEVQIVKPTEAVGYL